MTRRLGAAARAACLLLVLLAPRPAVADDEEPSDGRLALVGSLMAVPTYFLGVAWHEGSHALWAKSFGASITDFHIWPGFHPRTGRFFFGWVSWRGELSVAERTWVLLSPKATDLLLLGGYGALLAFDAMPDDAYGELALGVVATGAWVDFSKDLFSTRHDNDVIVVHRLHGRTTECQRLPWRVLHGALAIGGGALVLHGLREAFDNPRPTQVVMPLWTSPW